MTVVIGPYRAIEYRRDGQLAPGIGLWRGEDLRNGEEIALTLLQSDLLELARDELAAAAVVTHPHLLAVTDVVETESADQAALVAHWPAGGLLVDAIARRGPLSVGETLTVLIPLADAVATAHRANVRHGGICPDDIWFDDIGRPLLGPLAVSRVVMAQNRGFPVGSRDLAPETVRGEVVRKGPVTLAADVFSLGSVALACLTGRSAWPADEPADVLVQSAAGLWPDLPDDAGSPGLLSLIREMLSSAPEHRPSAADVGSRLSRIGVPQPVQFAEQSAFTTERPKGTQPRHLSAVPESNNAPPDVPGAVDPSSGGHSPGGNLGPPSESSDTLPDSPGSASPGSASAGPASPGTFPGPSTRPPAQPGGQRELRPGSAPAQLQAAAPAVAIPGVSRLAALVRRPRRVLPGRDSGPSPGQPGPVDAQAELRELMRTGLINPSAAGGPSNAGGAALARLTPLARTGLILLTGVLVTLVALQVSMWWDDRSASPAGSAISGSAGVPGESTDWTAVVQDLDAARGRALAAADPMLLAAVYGAGTPELQADMHTIQQLADQGLRVVDGVHQLVSVTVVNSGPSDSAPTDSPPSDSLTTLQTLVTTDVPGPTPAVALPTSGASTAAAGSDAVRLAVVDTLPAHPIVDVGGQQVGVTQARAEERRVLVLAQTEQGYRIIGVEPG